MIKNIPNKYTLPLLLDKVDKNYLKKYDFFYLPIDFKVNFREKIKIILKKRINAM